MKAHNASAPIALALAAGLTFSHQASGTCADANCTSTSLTVCSDDNKDCHKRYWIGYTCPAEVEFRITIHNGNDGKHRLGGDGEPDLNKKIWRWDWTKDAYVQSITCCPVDGGDCTLILDESSWRE